MKKKFLVTTFALIAAIICTFGLTACNNAEDNNTDGNKGGTVSVPPTQGLEYNRDYTCTAAACTGIGTAIKPEIVISDNCKGTPVEYISDSAFKDCTFIKSISIPDSVYTIEDSAFSGCALLESIRLSNNVLKLGNSAFSGCISLTSISLPAKLHRTGNSAFYGCTSLTSVSLPADLREIWGSTFYGCTSLTSINFAGTVEQWNDIRKLDDWDKNTGDYVVHCTDGDIEKI